MSEDRNGLVGSPAGSAQFQPTQWSVVLAARGGSPTRGAALQRLCSTYWLPVYGYLRRRGHAAADAEDLTQSFFAYLLESDFLDRPDAAKGRFRGYLIGTLKYFLSSHFERENAQKRGGGVQFVDWSGVEPERELGALEPEQPQADPSESFDANWAMVLFQLALRRLEEEQSAAGKAALFAKLSGFLSAPPFPQTPGARLLPMSPNPNVPLCPRCGTPIPRGGNVCLRCAGLRVLRLESTGCGNSVSGDTPSSRGANFARNRGSQCRQNDRLRATCFSQSRLWDSWIPMPTASPSGVPIHSRGRPCS
ncbi:MAG TPA: hypothetical protein VK163_00805 [Opitutaceae bacterium]|nr:hypothetical protein [Opitutaceae bacterium]